MTNLAQFPAKLRFLFQPSRYKIAYGGRGAAKSWGFARALLIQGAQRPIRVLCAREIQKSIKESVHQLLGDQIDALGLAGHYDVLADEIRGANGTKFTFAGLRHNVGNIPSKEGLDIVWVEEAQSVSKHSWEKLIPTIRKDGSEIWISFNPELEDDETYQRFVVKPPSSAKVVKINWRDNPWFPRVLREEMEELQRTDYDAYLTVWEGNCRVTLDGAIFANELRATIAGERIKHVPHTEGMPVYTFWDLGRADLTAIWFAQTIGFEHRLIDYYENCGHLIPHYLRELQSRPYVYGQHWLPHDAAHKLQAAEKTIKQQVEAVFPGIVNIVPLMNVTNQINAARTIFPRCWFDREKTEDGVKALKYYQFKVDPQTGQRSKEPMHNWPSHGSSAFQYFAVAIKEPRGKPKPRERRGSGGGWMAA